MKKKKRNKTLETYINNQNQESNYLYYNKSKIASFFSMQNIIFKKNTDPGNQIIIFLFSRPTLFFAVLSVDQKINLVSPI